MTVLQAILISGIYWFSAVETPYCLYYLMTTPMCAGALTGLILGDITTGLIVGAAVQMIFLAPSGFGGVVPTDKPAAGIITTAAVITTGISVEAGVVLAVPAALLFAQLHTVRRLAASIWVHMADKYAEEGNTRGIVLAGTLYPTLLKIPLFWLPMMLMVYFGTGAVGDIVNSLPQFLMNGLNAAGMLLPALGFAMTIRMIGRRELMPFFVGGFFFLRYSNLGTIPRCARCTIPCVSLHHVHQGQFGDLRQRRSLQHPQRCGSAFRRRSPVDHEGCQQDLGMLVSCR